MTRRKSKDLNWPVEQRYAFIEYRLYWEGRLNRGDLVQWFGLSTQQASIDINSYIDRAARNLVYDKSLRTYRRGVRFKPQFYTPSAETYLAELRARDRGWVKASETWIGEMPPLGCAPSPVRGIQPDILRDVLAAIHNGNAIQVIYQSMSRPEPASRWIEPYALADDGFRWHARAYCRNDKIFKDFLISRIDNITMSEPRTVDPLMDTAWHTDVVLEIGPHPELTAGQRRAIEMDYGMTDGKTTIQTRRALLYYALKRLGLDMDPALRRAQDQQIILLNRAQVIGAAQ